MNSQQLELTRFVATLYSAQPALSKRPAADVVRAVDAVITASASLQSLAVKDCNVGLTRRDENRKETLQATIAGHCKILGAKPKFNGDPRGYVVKLILKTGSYNTFGGAEAGYGVPTGK